MDFSLICFGTGEMNHHINKDMIRIGIHIFDKGLKKSFVASVYEFLCYVVVMGTSINYVDFFN